MTDRPRAALYTRVSTEDQAKQGFSLAAQERRLRALCRAQGWEVVDVYVDDGVSGRDIRRPAYQRMMAERDRWDKLVVLKMDRLHRNSRHFMGMVDDLRRWGRDLVSAMESLDTGTAMGRFVMDIIERIAQLESEQTAERVYAGMKEKAEQGGFNGMSPPYGYDLRRGRIRVNRREARQVRRIAAWRRTRRPYRWIAGQLNAEHVPTKTEKGRWTARQVYRIAKSPWVFGLRKWEDLVWRGDHRPILNGGLQGWHRAIRRRRPMRERP